MPQGGDVVPACPLEDIQSLRKGKGRQGGWEIGVENRSGVRERQKGEYECGEGKHSPMTYESGEWVGRKGRKGSEVEGLVT